MKAIEVKGQFGLDNLTLTERPAPTPGPHQLLLKMKAVSLNYRDLLTVQGLYNPRQSLPIIPCSDGVGEVVAVGEEVTRAKVGDRVCPLFAPKWIAGAPDHATLRATLGSPLDGTLCETMAVDEQSVVHVPAHLSDTQAATLPCAALTAWTALTVQNTLRAGDTILIQGTGGVSIFVLQLAQLFGAQTIVTSSSNEKLQRARELGANHTINYKENPKWGKQVQSIVPGGVDHIIEVGGVGTLTQSLKAIRIGGTIILLGALAGRTGEFDIIPIVMKQVKLQGLVVGHREAFESMNRAIATHQLQPVVDQTFTLQDAKAAFQTMKDGGHFGKICIQID